ncbi:hypothetical protein AVEN_176546-1 [Araneus ventricosus]|uniref:Uncharacterized protein n=1 Tax=Araneus ventricosus TaxID=182803 RepID=A0A4Y2KT61_ARAVE|nr:hypothetical protein AVEN_176546-1 [Araneus ventricosus]
MAHRRLLSLSGKNPRRSCVSYRVLVSYYCSRQLDPLTSLAMAEPSTATLLRLLDHNSNKFTILIALSHANDDHIHVSKVARVWGHSRKQIWKVRVIFKISI